MQKKYIIEQKYEKQGINGKNEEHNVKNEVQI